jgi:16S rRNA (guanine527-N7)-methyltransferase
VKDRRPASGRGGPRAGANPPGHANTPSRRSPAGGPAREGERGADLLARSVEPQHLRLLEEGAAAIGLRLDREQLALLSRHVDLLLRWNRSINLTSITDPAEVVEKHVIDSLALAPLVPAGTLLDAGTGAGFPGLPLRIARPDLEVVLVDSVQKKVAFLKTVLAELRLPGVRAVAVRLQGHPAGEHLPRVHSAVSRAVAEPRAWLALAEPYVLPGGLAFCMLGPSDPVPEKQGDLVLQRELGYRLPFSRAERRLAVFQRKS